MDLFEAIYKRRSIRSFISEKIPEEDIRKIIDAAIWAPSGSDSQPWEFKVVIDERVKKDLAKIVKEEVENIIENEIKEPDDKKVLRSYGKYFTFFYKAPAVIVIYGKKEPSIFLKTINKYRPKETQIKSSSFVQSMSAAVQNICLSAEALGYGTCWMTGPLIAEKMIKKALNIGDDRTVTAIIPLGKPKAIPEPNERKKIKLEYI